MPHFRSPLALGRRVPGGGMGPRLTHGTGMNSGSTGSSNGTSNGTSGGGGGMAPGTDAGGASGAPVRTDDHYAAVCAVLWSERELLESLACTVIVAQLMSSAGAASRAAGDVRSDVMHKLALQEVLRAAIVEALITATSAEPTATLRDLSEAAPEPWQTMLAEHRTALRALADDVGALADYEQLSLLEFLG